MKKLFLLLTFLLTAKATAQLKDCATCAKQVIKEQQIKGASIDELRFLTNDLYARKGYKFKDYDISNYFSTKPWYNPVSDNSKIKLNAVEEQNVRLFQERTAVLKADREKLLEALRKLKADVQKGEVSLKDNEGGEYFKRVITKIDIDEIHWIKKQGYYSVEIDNFKETYRYFILIEGSNVIIQCDEDGHSKKEQDDKIRRVYDTDVFDVMEGNFIWEFRWENQQLVFERFVAAG